MISQQDKYIISGRAFVVGRGSGAETFLILEVQKKYVLYNTLFCRLPCGLGDLVAQHLTNATSGSEECEGKKNNHLDSWLYLLLRALARLLIDLIVS